MILPVFFAVAAPVQLKMLRSMDIHGVSIRMQLLVNLALSQNLALAKLDKNKSTVKTNLIKFKVGIVAEKPN